MQCGRQSSIINLYVYKSLQPGRVASKKENNFQLWNFREGGAGEGGSRLIKEEPHVKEIITK